MDQQPGTAPVLPDGWRNRPAAQQPDWPDPGSLTAVCDELAKAPPLVYAGECDQLRTELAAVARGEAFLLQGGDCAETFAGVTTNSVVGVLETLLQMAVILTYATGLPVVKMGRMAGQFAKPRSRGVEERDGVELPAYRGDMINGLEFSAASRTPDPARLRSAYQHAASTLNLVRALTRAGGYADVSQIHARNRQFVRSSPAERRYERLAREIDHAVRFMGAWGAAPQGTGALEFYASHEALVLDYEHALTRIDTRTGRPYALSGHFLWVGERTRAIDGAHVEFVRELRNPIGVKLGPTTTSDDVLTLMARIDPDREPGRLAFITRMGADRIRDLLPPLIEKVGMEGGQAIWLCDPMHGNTFRAPGGYKTRRFDDVMGEIEGFFEVHRALGTHPGGIHVELTGDAVTECVGGSHEVLEEHLGQRYESACDPRLNHRQSLDLAFRVAELCRAHAGHTAGSG